MKKCNICGIGFLKNKKESLSQWKKRRFCSALCTGKFNSLNLLGSKYRPSRVISDKVRLAAKKIGLANKQENPISKTKAYRQAKGAERYARVIGAEGRFTHEDWLKIKQQYGCKCVICGINENILPLTIDHVIPVTKGGSNWPSNLQPLCQPCNSRKGNRI